MKGKRIDISYTQQLDKQYIKSYIIKIIEKKFTFFFGGCIRHQNDAESNY